MEHKFKLKLNPKLESILTELIKHESAFHHPKSTVNRKDLENLVDDDFWEVGASGKIYNRENVITILLERSVDPKYNDLWESKDFRLQEISQNNYLLTYLLIQNKRITRRTSIWRFTNNICKILYHQGTLVP